MSNSRRSINTKFKFIDRFVSENYFKIQISKILFFRLSSYIE